MSAKVMDFEAERFQWIETANADSDIRGDDENFHQRARRSLNDMVKSGEEDPSN